MQSQDIITNLLILIFSGTSVSSFFIYLSNRNKNRVDEFKILENFHTVILDENKIKRLRLAEFYSITSPSWFVRRKWKNYFRTVKDDQILNNITNLKLLIEKMGKGYMEIEDRRAMINLLNDIFEEEKVSTKQTTDRLYINDTYTFRYPWNGFKIKIEKIDTFQEGVGVTARVKYENIYSSGGGVVEVNNNKSVRIDGMNGIHIMILSHGEDLEGKYYINIIVSDSELSYPIKNI